MGITFASVALIMGSYSIIHGLGKKTPIVDSKEPIVKVVPISLQPLVEKPKLKPKTEAAAAKATSKPTIKYTEMVVTPDPVAQNPVKIDEIKDKQIASVTLKGKDDGSINIADTPPGDGNGKGTAVSGKGDEPYDANILEVMPQPYGGAAAWSKFLNKNLRYPAKASEEGKQGKVWLSFIIEKDGHLSNIVVDRGPGYGLDEEALRVLKLAPAWKPGIQNGHPVRVRYNIPISFVIPDSE